MNLQQKTKKTISKYNLLKKGEKILVAVSGGPDSMALLHLLYELRYEFGFDLVVGHLNHNLRTTSLRDANFVRRVCAELKLPFFSKKLKKSDLLNKGSLEEAAREYRLLFLNGIAKKENIKTIALGHNQDDLAETVLMRLLRGTGPMGIRGILPRRVMHGLTIIRPLLESSRKDISIYLKEKKISFVLDPSNKAQKFFRNKIRLTLLPDLEKNFSPNIKKLLANFAVILTDDYDFLERKSREAMKKIRKDGGNYISLNLPKLQNEAKAVQRMIIRLSIEDLKGNLNQVSFEHLEEIDELITERPNLSIVHLTHNVNVQKKEKSLTLSRRKT